MKIELTEQQARALAAAARAGLRISQQAGAKIEGIESISDAQSAYVAADLLDEAWRKSVGS